MCEAAATTCAGCQRLQAQLEQLQATVARLEEQLAAARKDSSTSSKPPSSDIVKPPPPAPPPGQDKRKRGGQPGHPKHERAVKGPGDHGQRARIDSLVPASARAHFPISTASGLGDLTAL